MRFHRCHLANVVTVGLLLSACQGNLTSSDADRDQADEASDKEPDGRDSPTDDGQRPDDGTMVDQNGGVAGEARLRRLTRSQYRNAVIDLLGESLAIPTELPQDTRYGGFAALAASQVKISAHDAEIYETAALDMARQAFSGAGRAKLVGCTPSLASDTCTREFLTAFGLRAWRRPLTEAQLERYVAFVRTAAESGNDIWKGLELAVAAMLQSPLFLYRVEIGEPAPGAPGRHRYDDFDMAARLSFFLWDAPPDGELLAAATAGSLTAGDRSTLQKQAQRLLASPRARSAAHVFAGDLFLLDEVERIQKDEKVYPQTSATLGAALREETLRVFDHHTLDDGVDFRGLFDTRSTFVNAELAKLYGLPAPAGAGFVAAKYGNDSRRAGILTQGSFLALQAHDASTNPSRRGKFVREMIMCEAVPPPPDNIPELPEGDINQGPRTMRERLTAHREQPACASCHALIDPIGLAFENFDGIGAERSTEAGKTIDASGDFEGTPFDGPRALAALLAKDDRVTRCFVRHLFRFAHGHVETDGEEFAIEDLHDQLTKADFGFPSLMVDLVTHETFGQAAAPQ